MDTNTCLQVGENIKAPISERDLRESQKRGKWGDEYITRGVVTVSLRVSKDKLLWVSWGYNLPVCTNWIDTKPNKYRHVKDLSLPLREYAELARGVSYIWCRACPREDKVKWTKYIKTLDLLCITFLQITFLLEIL